MMDSLFLLYTILHLALNGTVPSQIKKRGFRLWLVISHFVRASARLVQIQSFFYYPPFPLVRDTQSRPRQSHPEQKLTTVQNNYKRKSCNIDYV